METLKEILAATGIAISVIALTVLSMIGIIVLYTGMVLAAFSPFILIVYIIVEYLKTG